MSTETRRRSSADCLFGGDTFILRGKKYHATGVNYFADGRVLVTLDTGGHMLLVEDEAVEVIE